jgi:hypothetical protein
VFLCVSVGVGGVCRRGEGGWHLRRSKQSIGRWGSRATPSNLRPETAQSRRSSTEVVGRAPGGGGRLGGAPQAVEGGVPRRPRATGAARSAQAFECGTGTRVPHAVRVRLAGSGSARSRTEGNARGRHRSRLIYHARECTRACAARVRVMRLVQEPPQ